MGAPQKFKQSEVISALKKSRGMVSPAARQLGCEPDTIRNYARRYPRVQQTMDDQRDQFLDESEIQLIAAVSRREPWAIAFTLRTVGRRRGYVEKTEQDVNLRGTLDQNVNLTGFSDADIRSLISRTAPRGESGTGTA